MNKDHTLYLIKVLVQPYNLQFHIKDRYSSLQSWAQSVKHSLDNTGGIPAFPGKKWFGKLDPDFLRSRSQQIEMFLNMFLKHPEVLKSRFVLVYFHQIAVDD